VGSLGRKSRADVFTARSRATVNEIDLLHD